MTLTLTTITREEALDLLLRGTQTKRAEIEAHIRDLRSQLGILSTRQYSPHWKPAVVTGGMNAEAVTLPKRRKMSAATRKRMAEAQRARWAKRKGN